MGTDKNPMFLFILFYFLFTVLSPIKAPLLIESPPNFEGRFLLYIVFVLVAIGSLNLIFLSDVILGLYQQTTNMEELKWNVPRHYEDISFYKYDIIRYSITGRSELGQISTERKRITTFTIKKTRSGPASASEIKESLSSRGQDTGKNEDTGDSARNQDADTKDESTERLNYLDQMDEEWISESDGGGIGLQSNRRSSTPGNNRTRYPPSTVAVLGLIQVDDLLGII